MFVWGTKSEDSPKKDHKWNSTAENCQWCGKYRYDITVTNSIPCTVGWKYSSNSSKYLSKAEITELSFYTHQNKVEFFGYGKKTYDIDGEETGDWTVKFKVKLICTTDDEVLGITTISTSNLAVGQKFTFDKSSNIPTYNLSLTKKYTATIFDN